MPAETKTCFEAKVKLRQRQMGTEDARADVKVFPSYNHHLKGSLDAI